MQNQFDVLPVALDRPEFSQPPAAEARLKLIERLIQEPLLMARILIRLLDRIEPSWWTAQAQPAPQEVS